MSIASVKTFWKHLDEFLIVKTSKISKNQSFLGCFWLILVCFCQKIMILSKYLQAMVWRWIEGVSLISSVFDVISRIMVIFRYKLSVCHWIYHLFPLEHAKIPIKNIENVYLWIVVPTTQKSPVSWAFEYSSMYLWKHFWKHFTTEKSQFSLFYALPG